MPVPRRRHSKSRRDKNRTHKKLFPNQLVKCDNCGEQKLPHRICPHCGTYQGRTYHTTVTK